MTTYYERNKERLLAYQRAYAAGHREANAVYQASYFQRVTRPKRQQQEQSKGKELPTLSLIAQPEEPRMLVWD
jgi:hypothetical protein